MTIEAAAPLAAPSGPAVPDAPPPAKPSFAARAWDHPAAAWLRRYFTPLSALSLVGVIAIFAVCFLLWEVAWLRPFLAAGGAGLAAFLGPIPGIISPEARTKWLASIIVAALITAGSWLATQDLSNRLEVAEADGLAARETNQAHDNFVLAVMRDLPPQSRIGLFSVAPRKLWALYNTDKDYETLLDMSLMLLAVERENGHALYYAGEAYAKLGKRAQMVRMFHHYVAAADDEPDARVGSATACYSRPHGYCAERLGWISHILADLSLTEALALADAHRPQKLSDALRHEKRNLELVKWRDDHHNPGFDEDKNGAIRSSCDILMTIARERLRLRLDAAAVIKLGTEKLGDACGAWPA
jgi:hypothetical protein